MFSLSDFRPISRFSRVSIFVPTPVGPNAPGLPIPLPAIPLPYTFYVLLVRACSTGPAGCRARAKPGAFATLECAGAGSFAPAHEDISTNPIGLRGRGTSTGNRSDGSFPSGRSSARGFGIFHGQRLPLLLPRGPPPRQTRTNHPHRSLATNSRSGSSITARAAAATAPTPRNALISTSASTNVRFPATAIALKGRTKFPQVQAKLRTGNPFLLLAEFPQDVLQRRIGPLVTKLLLGIAGEEKSRGGKEAGGKGQAGRGGKAGRKSGRKRTGIIAQGCRERLPIDGASAVFHTGDRPAVIEPRRDGTGNGKGIGSRMEV